ncbi:MAG: prepilin-type N-terminal cleavage/methylation domain-containing protein [Holophaga sp.]|nr:prepilin-type N-terminal cleavage/methylation domain-containing protein [Holophaga sp.]
MGNRSTFPKAGGFTLVEAAVAIAVVAILAGIIIPLVLKSVHDARYARARNDIQVIVAAIANQMKDTGRRPTHDGGPAAGNASGVGDVLWFSGGEMPRAGGVPQVMAGHYDENNSFENLFALSGHAGNELFGLEAAPAQGEAQYRGPYLGTDMARKSDPWGHAYLILGYDGFGQRTDGPIWVVSAGEAGDLAPANTATGVPGGAVPQDQQVPVWDYTAAGSETNIAVRVH